MFQPILYVGIGSAIGGICRYLMQQYVAARIFSSFPFGTLFVNILGCFVIGVVYGLSLRGTLVTPQRRLFLATGICGGFTTFSSFMYENYSMLQTDQILYTFMYTAASLIIGFAATFLGVLLTKLI